MNTSLIRAVTKKDYTLYLSDPQAQYNKLLRTQQKLRKTKRIYQSQSTPT